MPTDDQRGAAAGETEGSGAEINQCPACGGDIDISGLSPFSKVECPHCEESVRVRVRLGNYLISRLLGEGGMSQVFLAEDLALDRQVALKILHQELSRNASLMAQFEREAKLTASINHPNVVKVYTVGSDAGHFFIAMELVDNVSLERRIEESGGLGEREALDLLHDVADGLRTAYQGGLIHRDIKPGNILLTPGGTGKLVDFGLALQQGGHDDTEELWATPFYVPPEKLEEKPDDFRGDIYSLGATFFHALAGHPPFDANTASLDELREIKAKPVTLRREGKRFSGATVKLIDRMMAYKPEARPQSYEVLLAAVEDAQAALTGGAASRARRKEALSGGSPAESRSWGLPARLGIGAGALAAVIALVAVMGGGDKEEGSLPTDLSGDSNDRVVSAGVRAVAARYTEAREMLLAGRAAEAAAAFSSLLAGGDLKQPTLGWTQFNAGLALLMKGEEPEAREIFASMAQAEGLGEIEAGNGAAEFFRKAGLYLRDPLPVMPSAAKDMQAGTLEGMGLLAFGSKNWSQGEIASAMEFLEAFAEATFPADQAWMEAYRSLVEAYRADAQQFSSLPQPSIAMSEAELAETRERLGGAVGGFRVPGGARAVAERRMARVDQLLEAKRSVAAAPPVPEASEPAPGELPDAFALAAETGAVWTPEAESERDLLGAALAGQDEALRNYRFAEAREAVEGVSLTSPLSRQIAGDLLVALSRAEAFHARLAESLAGGDWEGKLVRKAGAPIDCQVVAADVEKVVVDLMFGPNDLPWADVEPGWMLSVARQRWLGSAASQGDAAALAEAAWFARAAGMQDEAAALAALLSPRAEEFSGRWERLVWWR